MLMRALAFYNEFVSYTDVEKLFACPVDPSTDLSINIDQFYRADKVPKTVQEAGKPTGIAARHPGTAARAAKIVQGGFGRSAVAASSGAA